MRTGSVPALSSDRFRADSRAYAFATCLGTSVEVARVSADAHDHGMTDPSPPSRGWSLNLHLRDTSAEWWEGGGRVRAGRVRSGTIALIDHRSEPQARHREPFDIMHIWIPGEALDRLADDYGSHGRGDLACFQPDSGTDDEVIGHLCRSILPALPAPQPINHLFLDQVVLALLAHVADRYGGLRAPVKLERGSLAPWQERRAKELLLAHLDDSISVEEVARETGLSRSHFARAFRRSVGDPPHQWLMKQRLAEARRRLVESALSLAEVATLCGFSDQSHFSRIFRGAFGISPGDWRRQNRGPVIAGRSHRVTAANN